MTTYSPRSIPETLQTINSLALGVTGGLYIAGLLIVNLWLASFGVRTLEFNRAEYVLVGSVFALLVVASYFAMGAFVHNLREARDGWKERKWGSTVWSLISAFALLYVPLWLFSILARGNFKVGDWKTLLVLASLMAVGHYFRVFFTHLRNLWRRFECQNNSTEDVPVVGVLEAVQVFIFIVTSVGTYSLFGYPMVDSAYGGAQRRAVNLITTPRGTEIAKIAGLPVTASGYIGPVYLLVESGSELVVTTENAASREFLSQVSGTAIKISRSLVESVVSIKEPAKIGSTSKKVSGNG